MKSAAGVRCDSCRRIEPKNTLQRDHRPFVDSRDRFFDFVVPPMGKFRGIASESEPRKLAALHACPACAPIIKTAMKTKKPELLPEGPLRDLMMMVKSRDALRDMGIA